jgi:hypothetical protein
MIHLTQCWITKGLKNFHEYVMPLGRPRKNVKISEGEVTIESNPPGMLTLAINLIDTAVTRFDEFRLEPVEEFNPPGGWFGDLEPSSSTLLIERIGSPWNSPNGFHYEAPPFRIGYRPPMGDGALIEMVIDRYENNLEAVVRGRAPALLSLAKQAIYFSQAPDGARIVYGKTEGIKDERNQLAFERTVFAEDVPWAKFP